jgi:D-alanyl-D-alanine carboxypeptidase (penicillin-binding protein 5/6)
MVVALVTQAADPEPMVLVSAEAAATGGGGPQLRAGDRLPVSKLLAALLMASSNDAAVALAEHVAGSSERFVAMMNRLARSLGATGTHFVNPHGLDEPGHHSTAHDLALFGEELLDTPALARIVARRSLKVATTEGVQRFENTNLLLETYPGAVGVKTGYTIAAGNVLVAAAERGGRRLVSVVMNSADAFRDSSTLLDRGWRLLRRGVLLARGDPVASVVFDPGGATTAVAGATVRGPNDPASVVVSFIGRPAGAPAPAPGERVGTVRVVDDKGRIVATVPALAEGRVDEATGDSPAARLLGDILALGAKLIPVAP